MGLPADPIVSVSALEARYGETPILFGMSLCVAPGELVALLGRNGAGKSTALKAVMGLVTVTGGQIRLGGQDVTRWAPMARCRAGMGYVPQERRIFSDLTVRENLAIGDWRRDASRSAGELDRVLALFPALRDLLGRLGGTLSGGEQQMLAVARTLMGAPRLLLLDEPSEGLAPGIALSLARAVLGLKASGVSVLLSEQNYYFTKHVTDRVYVIEKGNIMWSGKMHELEADVGLRQRYLLV
jgi:branched-chain amino acid transport system ATP-binding protein